LVIALRKKKSSRKKAVKIVVHESDIIVDVYGVAKHFKLDPRRVQQLAKEGLPKQAKNEYPLIECLDWYVAFLQNALENKGAPTGDGSLEMFRSQKSRALTVTAQLKELELATKRSELVTVAESERVLLDFARLCERAFPRCRCNSRRNASTKHHARCCKPSSSASFTRRAGCLRAPTPPRFGKCKSEF